MHFFVHNEAMRLLGIAINRRKRTSETRVSDKLIHFTLNNSNDTEGRDKCGDLSLFIL